MINANKKTLTLICFSFRVLPAPVQLRKNVDEFLEAVQVKNYQCGHYDQNDGAEHHACLGPYAMFSKSRRRFCAQCQPTKDDCQNGFLEAQQVNKAEDTEY